MNDRGYLSVNRAAWNWRAGQHFDSSFYDVEGFLSGKNSLHEIELGLLGDVRDKSLLHLQCHFGQDTLSLTRLGAKAVGVDLSDEAIRKAGLLVLVEFHPVVWMFDENFTKIMYDYDSPKPIVESDGTYTDTTDDARFETVSWNHGLGDVVSSLIRHDIEIEQLREYNYSPYDIFPL